MRPFFKILDNETTKMVPRFGEIVPGITYIDRPGSYGIIINGKKEILIIKAPGGFNLPGGGCDPNETLQATLHREVLEETGFAIEVISEIGLAEQFVHAKSEGYFRKICSYFLCHYKDAVQNKTENDHEVLWCTQTDSLKKIHFVSAHRWALELAISKNL